MKCAVLPALVVGFGLGLFGADARAECVGAFGDITGDGTTTIVDAQCAILTTLWNLSTSSEPPPSCLGSDVEAVDGNCDESLTVSDVLLIIGAVLSPSLPVEIDADGNGCPDTCDESDPCADGSCNAVCSLPADSGPCEAVIPRWFFNGETGLCEAFVYGGCGGNENNFETQSACEAQGCEVDICALPAEPGPCKGSIERWYFNSTSGFCEKFIYGGCGGNANNFETQSDCEAQGCEVDICALPAEPGPCKGSFERWYFDSNSGLCEKFIYGGCGGNANNFETQSDCEAQGCEADVCALDPDPGPCDGAFPRWYFNDDTGTCQKFVYGGCGGNANNFESQADCLDFGCEVDLCSLPPDPGPCEALIPRWYFNASSKSCEKFNYGGCGGNANNFETQEACEEFGCEVVDVCSLPPDPGPCDAIIERWYFNADSGACETFTYGGCGGNANNYATEVECVEAGCDVAQCTLPADPGPCDGAFVRWYYNAETGICEDFVYGGCGGNANNFETKEKCNKAGCDEVDVCSLPADPGPCKASIVRWYFNDKTGTCQTFVYGGCGGNANNYETKGDCLEAGCEVDICSLPPDSGPCEGAFERWYFNDEAGACQKFIYGGCGGNANNFDSKDECEEFGCEVDLCSLPADSGPCEGAFPRWYFNAESGACQSFVYGGCGGNINNFLTQEACEESGCVPDPCTLPADPGPCDGAFPRWYFNAESGSCETFIYGGCGGNANNYPSQAECLESGCPITDVCSLPADSGPCEAAIPRWYFDAESDVCEEFIYGGCGGNANNFTSLAECNAQGCGTDICTLPAEPGPCLAVIPRYFFNAESGFCESFNYGGCGGNANNFTTLAECEALECSVDPCGLPADPGPCDAAIQRWYFNAESGGCETFVWGGCGGNLNRYTSKAECEAQGCFVDPCGLPAAPGPCLAVIPRWYFNAASGTCEPFNYGGCGGNTNNYTSEAECLAQGCVADPCTLPPDAGLCLAAIQRWYYNPETQSCETFTWGGCGGNINNFTSESACEEASCTATFCDLPPDPGPCAAAIERYYYNAQTGSCLPFTWGGCGGNSNNFQTFAECLTSGCTE